MANQEHLEILKQGHDAWFMWRKQHSEIHPDLSDADLRNADLQHANLSDVDLHHAILYEATLSHANLSRANLSTAYLRNANLNWANLSGANLSYAQLDNANLGGADLSGADLRAFLSDADLHHANLSGANLSKANLSKANLYEATLSHANLSGANLRLAQLINANFGGADLSGADLSFATLVRTNLKGTTLTECHIYGISAWDVELTGAIQENLVITPEKEPTITVDNLKIAQFIYLLLNNREIRDVINTLTTKAVLILGRFTPERKIILDALKDELRSQNYLPILFDFEKPSSLNFTETIRTLAHLARFIIADLTEPSSIPQELQAIVPNRAVPVQPILLEGKKEYSMFVDFSRFHWVLPVYLYQDQTSLLISLKEHVIVPAEQKAKELEKR